MNYNQILSLYCHWLLHKIFKILVFSVKRIKIFIKNNADTWKVAMEVRVCWRACKINCRSWRPKEQGEKEAYRSISDVARRRTRRPTAWSKCNGPPWKIIRHIVKRKSYVGNFGKEGSRTPECLGLCPLSGQNGPTGQKDYLGFVFLKFVH